MKIRVEINDEEQQIEIPFWQGFKLWIVNYLAFIGMIIIVSMALGFLSALIV